MNKYNQIWMSKGKTKIKKKTKLIIYKTLVKPTLTYNCPDHWVKPADRDVWQNLVEKLEQLLAMWMILTHRQKFYRIWSQYWKKNPEDYTKSE